MTVPSDRREAGAHERYEIDRKADELLDGFIVALQDFDTDTLLAIADHRDEIAPDGWMQRLIREYVDVWR